MEKGKNMNRKYLYIAAIVLMLVVLLSTMAGIRAERELYASESGMVCHESADGMTCYNADVCQLTDSGSILCRNK